MAILKKVEVNRKKGISNVVSKKENVPVNVELPDNLSKPLKNLSELAIVIYGNTGIGKSTLCRHFGKPFYFRFEPSSKWHSTFQSPVITHWNTALAYLRAAENNLKGFTTMVLDTAGPCYDRCLEGVCERLSISHPGKVKDYGASWKEVQKEFHQFHSRLASLNIGLIVVAHETTDDIETMEGKKKNMIIPHFSGWCMDFYKRWVDIIGYYFYYGKDRYLLIRGSDSVMAKCNTEDHFLTTGNERVVCIPMGNSSEEAYTNIMFAFDNKQVRTYEEILDNSGFNNSINKAVKRGESLKKNILPKKSA